MARDVTGTLAEVARAMSESPMLAGCSRASVRELADGGNLRQYRRATYLFHQGDPSPDLYFLWKGRVEVSSLSAGGRRQLHTILDQPQFFGEFGVVGEMPRTATAIALEDLTVWMAPGAAFLDFLAAQPVAARALLHALARQISAYEAHVEDLLFLDLKGRVSKTLLGLVSPSHDEPPPDGAVVPSVVTHADLASLSGGSRENITRILSDLQKRGIVERDGRRYVLLNVAALRRLAGL